jgi:hypothetical protein
MADPNDRQDLRPRSVLAAVLLAVGLIVVTVAMDLLFFRGSDMTVWRLIANVVVTMIAFLIYFTFIARKAS